MTHRPAVSPDGSITVEAVLLDMDGTLVSSVAGVERSWTAWAGELGVVLPDFAEVHGVPARALVDRFLADRTPADRAAALERIDRIELAVAHEVEVLPGARELLEALVPTGRCAIVTSSSRALARARLAGTALPEPALVTADDVARGKPHPDPYLAGAALLGVRATACLVVEDAAAGLAAGRASGAVVLGLRTTLADPGVLADLVVDDLSAVVAEPLPGGGVRVTVTEW
ncbi:MAG TPA: HAD-IA family hydrolase [Actinotalea sp.]|nr:HAD-IA family hydrolase [Actinotalea sp.]